MGACSGTVGRLGPKELWGTQVKETQQGNYTEEFSQSQFATIGRGHSQQVRPSIYGRETTTKELKRLSALVRSNAFNKIIGDPVNTDLLPPPDWTLGKASNSAAFPPPPSELGHDSVDSRITPQTPPKPLPQPTYKVAEDSNPNAAFVEPVKLPQHDLSAAFLTADKKIREIPASEFECVLTVGNLPCGLVYTLSGLGKQPISKMVKMDDQEKQVIQIGEDLDRWAKSVVGNSSRHLKKLARSLVDYSDVNALLKVSVLLWKIQIVHSINQTIEDLFKQQNILDSLSQNNQPATVEQVLRCKGILFVKLLHVCVESAKQACPLIASEAEQWNTKKGQLTVADYQCLQAESKKYIECHRKTWDENYQKIIEGKDKKLLYQEIARQKQYLPEVDAINKEGKLLYISEGQLQDQLQNIAVYIKLMQPLIVAYIQKKGAENSGAVLFAWSDLSCEQLLKEKSQLCLCEVAKEITESDIPRL